MNLLAVVFAFGPANVPINLVLLVVYVSVIRLATRDRPTAVTAVHRPDARSRDIGLAVTVAVVQFAGAGQSGKRRDRRPTLAAPDPGRGGGFPLSSRRGGLDGDPARFASRRGPC